jgi:hypothetical protein
MSQKEEKLELTWSLLAKNLRYLADHPELLRLFADEAERIGKEEEKKA